MGEYIILIRRLDADIETCRYAFEVEQTAQDLLKAILRSHGDGTLKPRSSPGPQYLTQSTSVVPWGLYTYEAFSQAERSSFDAILKASLADVPWSGSSRSVTQRDRDRYQHPTTVLEWVTFSGDVRARLLLRDMMVNLLQRWVDQAWRDRTYVFTRGTTESAKVVSNEDGAVNVLLDSACATLNYLFKENQYPYTFVIHLTYLPTDTQMQEASYEELAAQVRYKDVPDICLRDRPGTIRDDKLTIESKTRFRLKDVERYSLAEIWENFVKGRPPRAGLLVDAAYNAVQLISQALSYMASRGHPYGIISTYYTTWVLKADGKGTVWVSPGINYMTNGNRSGDVTVLEAMLFAALSSVDADMKPYKTANRPGGKTPEVVERRQTRSSKRAAEKRELPEESEDNTQPSTSRHQRRRTQTTLAKEVTLTATDLHLSCKLAHSVFLGSVDGIDAAVRLAPDAVAQDAAKREVAAYQHLQELQGVHLPRLLAYGHILSGSVFFVATELVKGQEWNWFLKRHRELDAELLSVLAAIHTKGVRHGDIHKGNMIVTADNRVVILDFDKAELDAPAAELAAEYEYVSNVLANR